MSCLYAKPYPRAQNHDNARPSASGAAERGPGTAGRRPGVAGLGSRNVQGPEGRLLPPVRISHPEQLDRLASWVLPEKLRELRAGWLLERGWIDRARQMFPNAVVRALSAEAGDVVECGWVSCERVLLLAGNHIGPDAAVALRSEARARSITALLDGEDLEAWRACASVADTLALHHLGGIPELAQLWPAGSPKPWSAPVILHLSRGAPLRNSRCPCSLRCVPRAPGRLLQLGK